MSTPKDSDIRPFLLFAAQPTRALAAVLPTLVTPEATSPWSPRVANEAPVVAGPSAEELAQLVEQAREAGRAAGFAETAALRAGLADVIEQLTSARAAIAAPSAELIAEVCGCVIEAWLDSADRAELLAPIVRGWLAASDQPATARVHPDDVAALTALIGDAPLAIVADPTLAPGALAILGSALEASHDWRARLPLLRTAIAAALAPDDAGDANRGAA